MSETKRSAISPKTMVLAGLLTALVVVLQFSGAAIRFGPFSVSMVLIPIVIGAATCGKYVGAWLGFVFGVMVMATGDAAAFFAVNVPGTVITVLLKGMACGYVAGVVYNMLQKKNKYFAAVASAIVCPMVNTGVFLAGCFVFFFDTITLWAEDQSVYHYMIFALVGINFLVELAVNIVLTPIIVRLIGLWKKQ